ncbi:MAG: transposase [Candidatus Omnitrophota bacterium]|jgi:putative transposase
MPRTKRLVFPGAAMHIMCRGNNRQKIFNSDGDKSYYKQLMQVLKAENSIEILHYCLLDNHVHFIVRLKLEGNLSKFMKQLGLSYFSYYKKNYGYDGHLWQGRYKSNIIDTDSYLLQCGKYLELNPVRCGIVDMPEEYAFSSYKSYAEGAQDKLITPSPAYMGLADIEDTRRRRYVDFVVDGSIIKHKSPFIGSEAFIKNLKEYYGIKHGNLKRGRPKKARK